MDGNNLGLRRPMNALAGAWMALALWLGGTGWARADLLYNQPLNGPGGLSSQNAPNSFGPFFTAFDNFTLSTGALVTGAQWQGGYFNGCRRALPWSYAAFVTL